jgi:release factor glutamine methyltransferase
VTSYAEVVEQLRAAGCVFAEDEATVLIDAADGDLDGLVARRIGGEPLEHIVGWAGFGGLRISVDTGVFVPRRRTELLAHRAAAVAFPGARVVELCCGAGPIGALVRAVVPAIDLHAADIEPRAVRCARRNLGEQVYEGDLYDALPPQLRGSVDVMVANAPYVPTDRIPMMPPEARDHEPMVTLDGGADGLVVLGRIVREAAPWLAPGGQLMFECGRDQVESALALFSGTGLEPMVVTDDELNATMVLAKSQGTS